MLIGRDVLLRKNPALCLIESYNLQHFAKVSLQRNDGSMEVLCGGLLLGKFSRRAGTLPLTV